MNDIAAIIETGIEEYGAKESLLSSTSLYDPAVAIIRTSDRISFKRCRRRWNWSSHLRRNLQQGETISPLWFGSGFHFAMEDFHGQNIYGHPRIALEAYTFAWEKSGAQLPPDIEDLIPLGNAMTNYYADYWLRNRPALKTFHFNGIPQVEVQALVEIDLHQFPRWLRRHYKKIYYSATFDRVIEDDDGQLWILDYKTAKQMVTTHLATDPQISAYCWLGNYMYGRPIAGLIYQQHRKTIPDGPKILQSGKISVNKAQPTSHGLYRAALVNLYGPDFHKWPSENLDFLNWLAHEETPVADHFVRRDRPERNSTNHEATGETILMEIEDMLDPTLPLYPNPTRDCSWCPFYTPCVSMDDGGDFEGAIESLYQPRQQGDTSWRKFLPQPQLLFPPTMEPPEMLFPS